MPSLEFTSNALMMNVPIHLQGNIGIGTTSPSCPLDVFGPNRNVSTASYVDAVYDDYTLTSEYANRTTIASFVGGSDEGYALLPDFGFDFYISAVNYRALTYVGTNSYFTFGQPFVSYSHLSISYNVPTLFVGVGDYVVNSISYSSGTYNNVPAMFVYYDGYHYENNSKLNKWCVVFQSNGVITMIILQRDDSEYATTYGLLGYGDLGYGNERYWILDMSQMVLQYGLNVNGAYALQLYDTYGPAANINGRLLVNGTIRYINTPAPASGTSLVLDYYTGNIAILASDARYKNNIDDLPPVLDQLMNLRTVSYNWKNDSHKWYGLLAQQVSSVFPDAAWYNPQNDTHGVHYTPTIVTILLKGIQELKLIDNQKTQQINDLLTRVEQLENAISHLS